jgi:hypothetical protein
MEGPAFRDGFLPKNEELFSGALPKRPPISYDIYGSIF